MSSFDNLRKTEFNSEQFDFKCPHCDSSVIDVIPIDTYFNREQKTHTDEFRGIKIRSLRDALKEAQEYLIECKCCGVVSSNDLPVDCKKMDKWLKRCGHKQETLEL